jgi:hypothetical protein
MDKTMKVKYTLNQIHPKIFLVGIENSYDLAMTFCRVQEFYESPYKEIKGKPFTITELQRIYSMRREDGCFTYPIDWAGYNVPSKAINNLYQSHLVITDLNEYDEVFEDIVFHIENRLGSDKKYYVIGSDPLSKVTIEHEVAHAFYYLHPSYKKAVDKITDKIPSSLCNKIKNHLLELGYNEKVIKDEIQAYLSADPEQLTEINDTSERQNKILNTMSKQIKEINKQYRGVN